MDPRFQTPSSYIGKKGPNRVKGRKYYTFRRPPADEGYAPGDILKLAKGQEARFAKDLGWYAANAKKKAVRGGGAGSGAGSGGLGLGGGGSLLDMARQYASMLGRNQQGVLDKLLEESGRRTQGNLASLAGFGASLMGYSHDLWGQTNESYRNAAAAQQSMAQGLGGQVGSGVAEAHAQQAALAGGLGHTGASTTPTAEAATSQVASEGGAQTGSMMGQVGTAWGGYGATRPEYIGFMTGQNQMQLLREAGENDRDLKGEFLKLGMGNLEQGISIATKMQESKAMQSESAWKRYMDRQNLGLEIKQLEMAGRELGIKDKQFWAELNVKKRQYAADNKLETQRIGIAQQNADISQQNADTAVTRAENTLTGKASTAYNSIYSKLYDLAKGGNNSPLYTKTVSGSALGPNATIDQKLQAIVAGGAGKVEYKKKSRPQARAALLARAQPFIAQYGAQGKKQILRDVEYLLDTMGFPRINQPKAAAAAGSPYDAPDLNDRFPDLDFWPGSIFG